MFFDVFLKLNKMNKNLQKDLVRFSKITKRIKDEADNYLSQINELPTAIAPPQLEDHVLPKKGLGTEGAMTLFKNKFADLMVASSGPRYWGFVTGGTTPAALAGDWLTTLYDQNCQSSTKAGDVSAVVEFETVKILRGLLRLPDAFSGGFVTGATMSNFTCLAVARQWYGQKMGIDIAEDGLFALSQLKVLSAMPHSCVHKDLSMLGIGRKQLIKIKTLPDNREAIDAKDLEAHLKALNGQPCIVTTSGGTVNTVDFDDMAAIAKLRNKYNFWWHIDAAFGAFAACSPKYAHLLRGWERADSISVDLHKWLNVPYDSAVVFVNEAHLNLQRETFQNANAAYLGDPKADFNYLNFLPENSRRMRALPAWMTLMAYGREGYQDIVERNIENAQSLGSLIEQSFDFQLLAPVRLNCVCFTVKRKSPTEISAFLNKLTENGKVFMTPTVYLGQPAIRAAFVNWRTELSDVAMAFEEMSSILRS
jgi:glutamate/tyrosine decarboxylase-like PLP-dependent enzyme